MKLIARKDIDIVKWDSRIASSEIENVFMYSWYLDAVTKNWCALITEDYKTILPLPFTNKLSVKQIIQAPFTREYDIVGNEFNWANAIEFVKGNFSAVHFRNHEKGIIKGGKKRNHQVLSLNTDFQKSYSTNAKRILKKTEAFSLTSSNDPSIVLDLFKKHVAHKIETISKEDLISLEKLMRAALKNNHGELLLVKYQKKVCAAGFFLLDKSRVTYLKGASADDAKKAGAMYFLIDQACQRYCSNYKTFDFGGSEIDKVAEFYHKFGATDRAYFDYTIDDLPFWFKTLKKLKR